ncbi:MULTISPECIES: ABC transporter ATP-binding protein [Paenarthrobacter]|uniref:ABC transporter ATP-binding protein n=1 Tax=Paenarthrobacter TaxID=1742992 RepID=UPI000A802411|nr:ABC transporter ATP-binding protein [Paenarthrobacter ureafaciens]MBN9128865.1 ABC transporter ATP-binding protein [Paenarthrobacter ureafaciens]RWW95430.1 ABC transporter ATP-binding protein [Paenarthrobacter ureafaciens]
MTTPQMAVMNTKAHEAAAPAPEVTVSHESREVLTISNVSKFFVRANGAAVPAVDGVSLSVRAGEFLVLLGPSGCGKTTLLRCIAGLEQPDSGRIDIDGKTVYSSVDRIELSAQQRTLSMVFQSYALWPNMSVFDNIAYPLRNRKIRKAQIEEDVHRIAKLVGIDEIIGQFPNHISGGQQQRVALARALVSGDALVLFDEPLSNVDAKVRKDLRIELAALQNRFGFAAVYVTHDQEDAMELGTKIAVLEKGKVAQVASPREVYQNPASRYVATFIGSTNELEGTVVAVDATGLEIETPLGVIRSERLHGEFAKGDEVVAIFRPEHGHLSPERPGTVNALKATFRMELFSGSHAEQVVTHNHKVYRVWHGKEQEHGTEAWISVAPEKVHVFER